MRIRGKGILKSLKLWEVNHNNKKKKRGGGEIKVGKPKRVRILEWQGKDSPV